ncbi:MAG: hypothetical protein NTV30_02840, partial [Chloroflexi bacterium]|nr:hypothetical protein [Chloroflexota bacterium]
MELRLWDWMVKPTHQEEWIEGKGLLSWLSFCSVALGAGMYFMGFVVDSQYLMLAGWLVTLVIGGGTKFLDLGKPARAWRMLIDYDAPGNIFNMLGYAIAHPA